MAKMVLIEAHPLLRLGLRQILGKVEGHWDIVGLDMAHLDQIEPEEEGIELLIFGLPIDTAEGWLALESVQRKLQPKRILLLTEATKWRMPTTTLPEGTIYGCLMKTASIEVLDAAIRLVMAGGQCFPIGAAPVTNIENSFSLPRPALNDSNNPTEVKAMPITAGAQLLKITPRQYEVLTLLARGYPIKTVSRMLNISVATAKTHACTLYQRLHVKNKGEAVYAALQRGATLDWDPSKQPMDNRHTYGMQRSQA
jgi:DNA-binding NarL/FixJ family response regulator